MAYTKKTKARRNYSSRSNSGRSSAKRTSRSTSRPAAKRSVQTLRIVVEQPSAVSSVAGVVPANQNAARKAVF